LIALIENGNMNTEQYETRQNDVTAVKSAMTQRTAECPHVSLAFSADRNTVVYAVGDAMKEFQGGLGLPLLLYFTLTLINKDVISYADDVTVDAVAAKENTYENSIGIMKGERVKLFTLFCAVAAVNAPDAIVALGRHISRSRNGKSTVSKLREIAEGWGIGNGGVKNLTGRYYDDEPQHFTTEDLLCVARELLSFDAQSRIRHNAAAYKDKYVCSDSILESRGNIVRHLCFGDERSLHAIALAEFHDETIFVAVAGAAGPIERDAAVLEAIHRARHPWRGPDAEWTDVKKDILTICGDTYCGERYTKWRKVRGIDDPIQRYGDDGYAFSFSQVRTFLSEDSFNIVNSECVLTPNYDKTQQTGKYLGFILGANPEKTIKCYKDVNINAVMLANNHMMDFGAAGCRMTREYFSEAGVLPIGVGKDADEAEKPLCLTLNGRRVIVFNMYGYFFQKRHELFQHYCFGSNTGTAFGGAPDIFENLSIFERIAEYRDKYSDALIILSPHWSTDFNDRHRHLRAIAEKAVDAGTDIIIGHGPHIPLGVEHIKGKIVVYSLGNFVFNTTGIDLDASGKSPYGIVARLSVDTRSVLLKLYPIYAHNMNTFFTPCPVDEQQFKEFLQNFLGFKKFAPAKDELGYCLEKDLQG
jgi:hypothetical protein